MHLKTTYFNYARHEEAEEETQVAINCYTKSGTHHMQVPRMLFDNPLELEEYVMKSHDRSTNSLIIVLLCSGSMHKGVHTII